MEQERQWEHKHLYPLQHKITQRQAGISRKPGGGIICHDEHDFRYYLPSPCLVTSVPFSFIWALLRRLFDLDEHFTANGGMHALHYLYIVWRGVKSSHCGNVYTSCLYREPDFQSRFGAVEFRDLKKCQHFCEPDTRLHPYSRTAR